MEIWYNTSMDELRDWLNAECEKRNLSWREASFKAGVAGTTISNIMNGQRPGLEVCKALARSFGVSPEFVLRLAGHLPPEPDPHRIPPHIREKAERLLDYWLKVRALDPESAERLTDIAVLQAEMVLAAARSRNKEQQEVQAETVP